MLCSDQGHGFKIKIREMVSPDDVDLCTVAFAVHLQSQTRKSWGIMENANNNEKKKKRALF